MYEARLGCVDLSCSGTVRTAPSTMFVRPAVAHSTFGAKHRMALGGTSADLRMLSSKPAGSSIDANEEQPSKAPLPMLVRLAGSSIDVNEEQSLKAYPPILVRPAGSSIDVNEEQR